MKKVIVSLLVIILVAAAGVGGWYLWDSLQKEKNKTGELENKIANIEKTDTNEKNNSVASNKETNDVKDDVTTSKKINSNQPFSKEDEITSNGLKLGMSDKEIEAILGEPDSKKSIYEDATGDTVKTVRYEKLGLKIDYRGAEDKDRASDISWDKENIKTARLIKVGSTKEELLNAYSKNSVLRTDGDIIVMGFEGDDPIYAVKDNTKIIFEIINGKVKSISMTYGHMN